MWVKKPIQQVGFYERALRAGEFRALRSAILFIFWLIPAFGLESKRDFGLCGVRPGSTWTGQPTRLDRARELVPWTPIVACGRDWCGACLQILNILDQRLDDIFKFCIFLTITVDFITCMHDRGMISSKNLTNFRQRIIGHLSD